MMGQPKRFNIERVTNLLTLEERLNKITDFLASFAHIVNPDNSNISILYPMSGYDIITPLLMVNPSYLLMVQKAPMDLSIPSEEFSAGFLRSCEFLTGWACGGEAELYTGQKFLAELCLLSVNPEDAQFSLEGKVVEGKFEWKHPYAKTKKECRVTMISEELQMMDKELNVIEHPLGGYEPLIPKYGFDAILFKAFNDVGRNSFVQAYLKKKGSTVITDCEMPELKLLFDSIQPVPLSKEVLSKYNSITGRKKYYNFGHPNDSKMPLTIYKAF